jgi:tRNA pseudouridine55 synthase
MIVTIPPKFVVLHKKRGETPLQVLEAWKGTHPEWGTIPMSYAGRLDPMAEGKLLMLLGDECKKQGVYTKLDKEYEVEVVFDVGTDSGDVLGLATYSEKSERPMHAAQVRHALSAQIGTHVRTYPKFSSKTVAGKPLFLYTLENKLNEIEIPTHEETIYKIEVNRAEKVSRGELQERIQKALEVVPRSDEPSKLLGADFRQDAVRARWQELFKYMPDRSFTILRIRVTCGSGAYMRTLAEQIGASLGTTAFALFINRTRIGKYFSFGPFGFWVREYK